MSRLIERFCNWVFTGVQIFLGTKKNTSLTIDSPLSYKCYRTYLKSQIETNSLTYSKFLKEIRSDCTESTLKRILAKNEMGEFKNDFIISPEKFVEIMHDLKLNESEMEYLLLLKLKNDSLIKKTPSSKKYYSLLDKILNKVLKNESKNELISNHSLSTMEVVMIRLIHALPLKAKNRILLKITEEVEKEKSRTPKIKNDLGVKKNLSYLEASIKGGLDA